MRRSQSIRGDINMTDADPSARYRSNLQGEVDSASLYLALAQAEQDPHLQEVYRRLAAVEDAHAEFWRKQLARIGVRYTKMRPGWRMRFTKLMFPRIGVVSGAPTRCTYVG